MALCSQLLGLRFLQVPSGSTTALAYFLVLQLKFLLLSLFLAGQARSVSLHELLLDPKFGGLDVPDRCDLHE